MFNAVVLPLSVLDFVSFEKVQFNLKGCFGTVLELCGLVIKEVHRVPDGVLGQLNMVLINIYVLKSRNGV